MKSESKLGAAPVPALCIVPDGVVGSHADPVGDGTVLAHLLGQLLLDLEGLVGRHFREAAVENKERRRRVRRRKP